MTHRLTSEEYAATTRKLALMRERLTMHRDRSDLGPAYRTQVLQSYERTIKQLLEEIRLYEAMHPQAVPGS